MKSGYPDGHMSEDFDVIVVGAGSGGGVVAGRLSEDPSLRILLLEAGPDLAGDIPDDILYVRLGSGVQTHDWDYSDPSIGSALPRGKRKEDGAIYRVTPP